MVLPLDGREGASRTPAPFLQTPFDEQDGVFSPDGKWIAYDSNESGETEVYIRAFPSSGGKWQVSSGGGNNPRWRGDGKEILFRGQELDSDDLVMMAAEVETTPTFRVGAPKVLFRLPGPVKDSLGAVSHDGQRFVLPINVPADKTAQASGVE